jgi:hypothetical protein
MKRLGLLTLVFAMSVGLASRVEAATISLFMNSAYVDVTTEGANLQADLVALGHTVVTFTGITAADFTAAGAGGALIFFPEMEDGDLFSDLDAAAIAALQGYVSGGGGILQANYFFSNDSLPNGLFGYALIQSGGGATSLNAGDAAGTPFAGGPAILPSANAVQGVQTASLPAGALNLYSDGADTTVFATNIGLGHYVYLGYDWFGGTDPDWLAVTDRAVAFAADSATVPEPATLLLLSLGAAIAVRRRR